MNFTNPIASWSAIQPSEYFKTDLTIVTDKTMKGKLSDVFRHSTELLKQSQETYSEEDVLKAEENRNRVFQKHLTKSNIIYKVYDFIASFFEDFFGTQFTLIGAFDRFGDQLAKKMAAIYKDNLLDLQGKLKSETDEDRCFFYAYAIAYVKDANKRPGGSTIHKILEEAGKKF